jgi:hypothetical protein
VFPDDKAMPLLVTLLLDLVFAFAGLCSVYIAFAWGELCGIRPGGDKSGLGGFAFVLLFALLRGVALAIGLLVVARDGESWWLLLVHLGLGVLAWRCFEREVRRVQADRWPSLSVGLFAGVLLPLPVLTLVLVRTNERWLGDGVSAWVGVAGGLVSAHALCCLRQRSDMRRARP